MIKMWTPKVFYAPAPKAAPFDPGPTIASALRKRYSVEKGYTIKEVLVGSNPAYYRTIGEVLKSPAASDSSAGQPK